MEKFEIKYKTNFYSREKTIVFSDNALGLYVENNLLIQIDKEEMNNFRFGIKWIRGIGFMIR